MRGSSRMVGALVIGLVVWGGTARPVASFSQTLVYPNRDWRTVADVGACGWSSARLEEARAVAEAIGSAAVMVVDRGVVIAAWGDLTRKYKCHSIRKSLTSALFGIAWARGRIDLDARLGELGVDDTPPVLTSIEKQATVENLLQARSGVYHPALSESPEMKARRPDRHSHPPGTFWYYNNWDFNALGTVYETTTGRSVFDAFADEIAAPIGMQDFAPGDGSYKTGPESLHPAYHFRMSTRDLARFGLLYLRQGRWKQGQVIPPEWVVMSTRPHSSVGFRRGYGYMWWTLEAGSRLSNIRVPEAAYYAAGYRGHRMFLFPGRDLLIAHRVNTDLPANGPRSDGLAPTIDNHRIGRLLWKLLHAAGMQGIGPDPSWAAAPGRRLDDGAIKELLLRKSIELENGLQFTAYADGRCAIFRQGKMLEQGRWWVEADLLCSRWTVAGYDTVRRYRLAMDDKTIFRYEEDGTFAGAGRVVD